MEVDQLHRQLCLPVSDQTQIGQVRRATIALSSEIGLDETIRGKLAIIATEMASNIVKHAGHGEILLRPLSDDVPGLEVLALDQGPGMADPERCLRDGYSTAGSSGTGLGAVQRLSDTFDLYSQAGKGTAMMAQLWAGGRQRRDRYQIGCVCLPMRGERVAGDAWAVEAESGRLLATVADGLGHGAAAAVAAEQAMRVFKEQRDHSAATILERAHEALRSTRGATMAIAEVYPGRQQLEYCGIGNIYGAVVTPSRTRSLVSLNGTVGHELRKVRAFSYPYPEGALLILHSDGMATRWNLEDYVGIFMCHPALVAGVLYRDYSRQRDDVSVLVVRSRA